MAKNEKIKPIELVNILNEPHPYEGGIEESSAVLEEELWGINNGVYAPIGKLSLPVDYKKADNGPGVSSEKGIITVFNNSFFGDPHEFYTEELGFGCELKDLLDHVKGAVRGEYGSEIGSDTIVLETKGTENAYDLVMKQHIPKFLQLYDQVKGMSADRESLQCIRKAFTDYRKE